LSPLDRLLADVEVSDWILVADAVGQLERLLAERALSPEQVALVARQLTKVALHSKWEVRRAVVSAARHLDRESALVVLARLVDDERDGVKTRAREAIAALASGTQVDYLKAEHEDYLASGLAEIEKRYTHGAREAARRLAVRYTALSMRELYHELVRAISPADQALSNLEFALQSGKAEVAAWLRKVQECRESLDQLTHIVESAKWLADDIRPKLREERLEDAIREAARTVEARWRSSRGSAPSIRLDADPALSIVIDRKWIVQALANVLENALESYAADAPERLVSVEARAVEGRAIVSVEDHGRGMDDEALKKACRLGATSKPSGIGFGLPLTRRVIESMHGGLLHLESRVGEGTRVTITLPLEPAYDARSEET